MDIRRLAYLLLSLAFALAIYGHNAFGMPLGTAASVVGLAGYLAALRWRTIGLWIGAAATAALIGVYATTDGLSVMTSLAMAGVAAGLTLVALAQHQGTRFELVGGMVAFVANGWFVWGNILSGWTPQFAFVNIAMSLAVAVLAWRAVADPLGHAWPAAAGMAPE